jgi:hypothetical protein
MKTTGNRITQHIRQRYERSTMKKFKFSLGIVVILCLMITAIVGYGVAYASSSFLTQFNGKYGTSGTVLNTCGICHINPSGGGTRNSYGSDYANASIGNHTYNAALEARDSDGDSYNNITEINARTFPGNASSRPGVTSDTTPPTVTAFSIPPTGTSLTVAITSFTATDNVGATGYLINESATKPLSGAAGWRTTPPPSYIFASTGTKTLYAWAKDAAGNVSASRSATVAVSSSGGAGTSGTVSGVVKDIISGAAVSGAVITDGTRSTSTGSNGSYSLRETNGKYTLRISKTGYLTTSQVVTVSGGGNTVNWALTKSYGTQAIPAAGMNYVIFAWNDLGMHCDQDDYSYLAVLPPYNTLKAQIFRRGSEGASLITSGITVSYSFPKKKNSALHTNFWVYAPQFGWNVPTNVGITGTPLAGNMKVAADGKSWEAVGIPITPYDDDGTWDPYGTAVITVKNSSGSTLQTVNVVAPVSTEMKCSNCHGTVNPQLDILQKHDAAMGTTFVAQQAKGIVHLCSECHSDNALGKPGKPGIPSLSEAMHDFHQDKMSATTQAANTTPGCYNCHPGPKTQCLRGVMARAGKSCEDCHGNMAAVSSSIQNGRRPWVDLPKCGDCHDAAHAENSNTLYRNSLLMNSVSGDMNGRIYCEACHNSPHSELITTVAADSSVSKKFQGDGYWIWNCAVCHGGSSVRAMHSSSTQSGGSTPTGSTPSGSTRGDD